MFIHRPVHDLATKTSYFIKTADVIIEKVGDKARAVDRYGNLICDGDDVTTLREAIDKAPINARIVNLGEFVISSKILVKSNIEIIGGKFVRKGSGFALFELRDVENVKIRGIMLDNLGDQSSFNYNSKGIWIVGSSKNVVVEDMYVIHSQGNPIIAEQDAQGNIPSDISIRNNIIENSFGDGIFVRANNVEVVGNHVVTCNDAAIDITAPSGGYIEKIRVIGNDVYGALAGILVARDVRDVVIEGNIARNGDGERGAIYVTYYEAGQPAPDRVTICGNIIKNSVAGIRLLGDGTKKTVIVEGNIVESITYTYGSGIIIASYPNAIVKGNKVKNIPNLHGIYVLSSSGTIVEGNVIENVNDTGIFVRNSQHVQVRNNRIDTAYYGIREYVSTGETTDYNIIENNDIENVTTEITIVGTHTYCDRKIYDVNSLPNDGFAVKNKPVLVYDNATNTYYLAVWNGSAWFKVAVS